MIETAKNVGTIYFNGQILRYLVKENDDTNMTHYDTFTDATRRIELVMMPINDMMHRDLCHECAVTNAESKSS